MHSDISSELFFRVHRSYSVNHLHIDGYDTENIYLKNGEKIPLNRYKEFRAVYNAFKFQDHNRNVKEWAVCPRSLLFFLRLTYSSVRSR